MDKEIRGLRAAVRRLAQGKPRTQVRYPEAFRQAAVTVARRRHQQGGSVTRLAREIGVSEPTLTQWLRPPAVPGLRPVAVVRPPSSKPHAGEGPVLITPTGVRIEGLDAETLVTVLRALA